MEKEIQEKNEGVEKPNLTFFFFFYFTLLVKLAKLIVKSLNLLVCLFKVPLDNEFSL